MERERSQRGGKRPRKKVCMFCIDRVERIDYKDVAKLKKVWYNRCVILAHALHGRNPEGGVLSMAKKQESYELMTVFSLKNGEEAVKELVEKFREKIASAATLDEVNEWGKRKLAYPINDEPDGYYTLYTFTSTPDVPAEVERVLNITDGVLRSLVTVK